MSETTGRLSPDVAGCLPRRIVIVGHSESAWMAAAVISQFSRSLNCSVAIVTAGEPQEEFVGEATQPSLLGFIRNLNAEEHEMMRACRANWHLATQFSDWVMPDRDFWIPLRDSDPPLLTTSLFHGWLAEHIAGRLLRPLHTFAVHWGASLTGRAPCGFARDSSISASGTFAWQLCGQSFALWLKSRAVSNGVQVISGTVVNAAPNGRGGLERIRTDSGQDVPGDLFVDCSGPDASLIRGELGVHSEQRSDHSASDRMVRLRLPGRRQVPPFIRIAGQPEGWCWQESLHGVAEFGLCYRSDLTDDRTAESRLREFLQRSGFGEPADDRHSTYSADIDQTGVAEYVPLSLGRQDRFWIDNVVAIGSSAARLDPLISAGRHLTQAGLELLIELFPERRPSPAAIRQYNAQMRQTADELSAFAQLHYLLSRRDESTFWKDASQTNPSAELQHRLSLFTASGHCGRLDPCSFGEARYQHLLAGCGHLPERPALHAQAIPPSAIQSALSNVLSRNDKEIKDLPLHEELLDWVHPAPGSGLRTA